MATPKPNCNEDTDLLLKRAAAGDKVGWGVLLSRHRGRLRRMVALRLDQRLQGRIDPSDVIQEACLEASVRLDEYISHPSMPFFLWLRFLTAQKLIALHRHHLKTDMRDAGREISLYPGSVPATSSADLASRLLGRELHPGEAAIRAETKIRLQEALNGMEELDREVLALRHFEQLNNRETAQALGINESAASKRYVRALRRLKEILTCKPGGMGGLNS